MRSLTVGTALIALAGALVACGESGSSSSQQGAKCPAATGEQLVVLQDDKHLQTVDNVIPAINKNAATAALTQALDKVGAALTTDKLVALNRQVDVERQTPARAAETFVNDNGLAQGVSGGSGKVTVGGQNFSEGKILANIYVTVLKAAGFDAEFKAVGNRELYLRDLGSGAVDVMPEYVGTLTEFLNKQQNGANAPAKASGDLDQTVTALRDLGTKANLVFGTPAQAADQNAFAVTKAFADANGLVTLSDLASKCAGANIVLGGPTECQERPFCKPGLEQTYGLKFSSFVTLDAAGPLTKTAIRQGRVQIGLVLSSDGGLG